MNRIEQARKRLYDKYKLFTNLLITIEIKQKENIGTACTDGYKIYIDPEFMNRIDDVTLEEVILHELLHIIRKDVQVAQKYKYDFQSWNIATDLIINNEIIQDYGIKNYFYQIQEELKLSTEQQIKEQINFKLHNEYYIYRRIMENKGNDEQNNQQQGDGNEEQQNNQQNNRQNNQEQNNQQNNKQMNDLRENIENEEIDEEYKRKIDDLVQEIQTERINQKTNDANKIRNIQKQLRTKFKELFGTEYRKMALEDTLRTDDYIVLRKTIDTKETVVIIDISGSMTEQYKNTKYKRIEVALMILNYLRTKLKITKIILGNYDIQEVKNKDYIKETICDGGTDLKYIIERTDELLKKPNNYIILITDAEDDIQKIQSKNKIYGIFITEHKTIDTNIPYITI